MNRKKLSGAQNRALASKRAKEFEKNKRSKNYVGFTKLLIKILI